jgi:hypothetical protein
MSELRQGKDFREIIEEEKNKGKTYKKVMRVLTSINEQVLYGGTFLFFFIILDVALYFLLSPDVFVWTGLLIATALVSSLLASRVSSMLKRNQWKFNA